MHLKFDHPPATPAKKVSHALTHGQGNAIIAAMPSFGELNNVDRERAAHLTALGVAVGGHPEKTLKNALEILEQGPALAAEGVHDYPGKWKHDLPPTVVAISETIGSFLQTGSDEPDPYLNWAVGTRAVGLLGWDPTAEDQSGFPARIRSDLKYFYEQDVGAFDRALDNLVGHHPPDVPFYAEDA